MADLAYWEVYVMGKMVARLRLIMTYGEAGSISETARRWQTSNKARRSYPLMANPCTPSTK